MRSESRRAPRAKATVAGAVSLVAVLTYRGVQGDGRGVAAEPDPPLPVTTPPPTTAASVTATTSAAATPTTAPETTTTRPRLRTRAS